MTRICCRCKTKAVEEERITILNSHVCSSCAHKMPQSSRKGIMVWQHKTAPTIQIVSEENFKDYDRYNPKYGHGSGVHKVLRKTVK